jgi:hypothetical protein
MLVPRYTFLYEAILFLELRLISVLDLIIIPRDSRAPDSSLDTYNYYRLINKYFYSKDTAKE